MDHLLTLLLGATLTWAFYFIQRRVERRAGSEVIARSAQLLALRQGLVESRTTLDELRAFEKRLIGQAQSAVRTADTMVSRAESFSCDTGDGAVTQDNMTRTAFDALAGTNARLVHQVAVMRAQLDGAPLMAFDAAQEAWLAFREHYARFIAQAYGGEPIQPLIRAVTLDSVTGTWINELDTQLGLGGAADAELRD